MPTFFPGLQLNHYFYHEVVQPLLTTHFPSLCYSASLIGYGSDVLGYDTEMSTDHNWGPRLQLFFTQQDHQQSRDAIDAMLCARLPRTFRGFPVTFTAPDHADGDVQRMADEADEHGALTHMIEITTLADYFNRYLGRRHDAPLTTVDWLALGEQRLLEITAGRVYHDGLQELEIARASLAYYPHDIWLYRLASQWQRISQEEAFVGRCGDVGDELGSRIVATRIVRDLMKLGFLLERRYAPYSKWFGTAFARLDCAKKLSPCFQQVLAAESWQQRQHPLCDAYVLLAQMHNSLGITAHVEPVITDYFNRPFKVLFAGRYGEAAKEAIQDPFLRNLSSEIGAVDQFVDSTDFTTNSALTQRIASAVYTTTSR